MAARHGAFALVTLLLVTAPCIARADEFSDFRVPANRVLLWTGRAGGSTGWSSTGYRGTDDRAASCGGQLGSDLYYRAESDSRLQQVSAGASGSGSARHERQAGSDDEIQTLSRDSRDRRVGGSATLGLLEQWYPCGSPVSVSIGIGASLQEARDWYANNSLRIYRPPYYYYQSEDQTYDEWDYYNTGTGNVGVGIGRVRNATGLYEAAVLEARLLTSGALTRPLGADAKRDLAKLLYARSDYSISMERPAAAVWGAIEEILRRDGALSANGIGARALFDAAAAWIGSGAAVGGDGLPASPVLRQRGWAARAYAGGSTRHTVRRADDRDRVVLAEGGAPLELTQFARSSSSASTANVGIVAEYHRPCGLRWQWDATGSTQWDIVTRRRGVDERVALVGTYIVSDRWLASASFDQSRVVDQEDSGTNLLDNSAVSLRASCEYWVSDHVNLGLHFGQGWSHAGGLAEAYSAMRDESGAVSFSVGYRFAGFTQIPGIAGLVR